MLRGHLDSLTSAGFLEGWAYDTDGLGDPLLVSISDMDGSEVAHGLANYYREDLAKAGCGIGWCHFRLRAEQAISRLRGTSLKLLASETGELIHLVTRIPYEEVPEFNVQSIEQVTSLDPTVCGSVDQLDGCEGIFDNFIKARGVDAFTRTAYVYILGRMIDSEGLALYGRLIRQKIISPYAMLRTLAESSEFRSRPRSLTAPTMSGFPFRCDSRV